MRVASFSGIITISTCVDQIIKPQKSQLGQQKNQLKSFQSQNRFQKFGDLQKSVKIDSKIR